MGKGEITRKAVIDAALARAAEAGLGGLSFGTLARDAGLSKSGMFAHFQSKDELELSVVEAGVDLFTERVVVPALDAPAGMERLRALYRAHLDWISGERALGGCPFVKFVQDLDDRPGAARDRLAESQRAWRSLLADNVKEARKRGQVSDGASPAQIAFELVGAALAFQAASDLLEDPSARAKAERAFTRIVS